MSQKAKNWSAIAITFVVLFILGLVGGLKAQQQFSGGQTVSITGALPTGANTIGAVTQASGPWTNNLTQVGGTNVSTGTGASGSGIPRVTVSNDSNVLATQSGTWNADSRRAPPRSELFTLTRAAELRNMKAVPRWALRPCPLRPRRLPRLQPAP